MSNELTTEEVVALVRGIDWKFARQNDMALHQLGNAIRAATLPAQASSAPDAFMCDDGAACGMGGYCITCPHVASSAPAVAVPEGFPLENERESAIYTMGVNAGAKTLSDCAPEHQAELRALMLGCLKRECAPAVATGGAVHQYCMLMADGEYTDWRECSIEHIEHLKQYQCSKSFKCRTLYTHPAPTAEEATGGARQAATVPDAVNATRYINWRNLCLDSASSMPMAMYCAETADEFDAAVDQLGIDLLRAAATTDGEGEV